MDLDIGSMIAKILPILDYYITFFTKVLTNLAASLGFDLDLPALDDEPQATPGDVQ